MQNVTSNLVYVVSLSPRKLGGSGLSSRDIAVEHDRYFHPMGGGRGGWPKTPPNYLRFRFDGRLQQIRHVESYEVVHNAAEKGMPGFPQLQGPSRV
jgi:hypothetical protein